jgi:hypothetical protein
MKHNGIDYKTSAVQYYLNNNESMDKRFVKFLIVRKLP